MVRKKTIQEAVSESTTANSTRVYEDYSSITNAVDIAHQELAEKVIVNEGSDSLVYRLNNRRERRRAKAILEILDHKMEVHTNVGTFVARLDQVVVGKPYYKDKTYVPILISIDCELWRGGEKGREPLLGSVIATEAETVKGVLDEINLLMSTQIQKYYSQEVSKVNGEQC